MEEIRKAIAEAAENSRSIVIEYVNAMGVVSVREINEISLNGNNFRANCMLRNEERHFRVDRVISIERRIR